MTSRATTELQQGKCERRRGCRDLWSVGHAPPLVREIDDQTQSARMFAQDDLFHVGALGPVDIGAAIAPGAEYVHHQPDGIVETEILGLGLAAGQRQGQAHALPGLAQFQTARGRRTASRNRRGLRRGFGNGRLGRSRFGLFGFGRSRLGGSGSRSRGFRRGRDFGLIRCCGSVGPVHIFQGQHRIVRRSADFPGRILFRGGASGSLPEQRHRDRQQHGTGGDQGFQHPGSRYSFSVPVILGQLQAKGKGRIHIPQAHPRPRPRRTRAA